MWKISALDVIHLGRSPGGNCFTEFVSDLIHSQAFICGSYQSEIRTNLRTNIPDGGVDAEVCKPIPTDTIGWLKDFPTIWQYKATEARNISKDQLKEEINKCYVADRIREGYAYRLCICDDLPPSKKEGWEQFLTNCIHEINPDAPKARILAASDIATWANSFPALVLRYFHPQLATSCLHLDKWKKNITDVTPEFVPVPAWNKASDMIKHHIDFMKEVPDVVLPISGEAGVGKTRLVYECLASFEGARNFVIYADDEQKALELARLLANDSSLKAILVADECSINTRVHLNEVLRGAKERVRVIAIDNSGERPSCWEVPEIWLERIPREIVEKILAKNYPEVPEERRRAYADLAGGFVRLAADLCRYDRVIASAAGYIGPALGSIRDYLRARVTNEELRVLKALSLVTKVGMKGDVAQQLDDLCNLVDIDVQHFRDIANRLHDGPGFVARAGRFFYVTPEVIAQIGFDLAWLHWARDPQEFLQRIPQSLLEPFLKRVARSASNRVRQTVGDFFRGWANSVVPGQLASVETVDRFVTLVEVDPRTYLPTLRRIVEESTREDLTAITGDSIGGRWGPRRSLVWLAEHMAAFPEHFEDAERILLRLALAESEPKIANNATAIWKQLFRIFLSGTAIPFVERLHKLEERIFSDDKEISSLAIDALDGVFTPHGMRIAGPPVVAGRILPMEWRPKTHKEYKECMDAAVTLLQKVADQASSELQKKARDIAIDHARTLLTFGYLTEMKVLFPNTILDDELRIRLIEAVNKFLHYEPEVAHLSEAYVAEVEKWLKTLNPSDFHGKVVTLVGVDPWYHSSMGDEEKWKSELHSLAIECLKNPDLLRHEIKWLCSEYAKSAILFGEELGKLDKDAIFLDLLLESSLHFQSMGLARGYIYGLLGAFPDLRDRVNIWIDKIQDKAPELAYELFMAGGDMTKALKRTLQLFDSGKLPVTYFGGFLIGIGSRPLSEEEIKQLLFRLIKVSEQGDTTAKQIAIKMVAFRLKDENRGKTILEHSGVQSLVWRLMELTAKDGGGESYWWALVLKTLAMYDTDRAVKIAALGLVGESLSHMEGCEKILITFAQRDPEIVMKRVGEVILDDRYGWHFYIHVYRALVQALPVQTVKKWIKKHGVEAARRLARHLPVPYVDSDGKAIVPPLTEFVLETFEDDDQTFREFCAGVHGLQLYSGDIAAQHEKEAEVARKFLDHPLRRVREWAQIELESSLREAEEWHQIDEEMGLDG